jgi:hypothetical protein
VHVHVHVHVARGAETGQQAETQSVPGRLLIDVRLTAVRWLFLGASQSSYNESYCVTELLRYFVTACLTAVSRYPRRHVAFIASRYHFTAAEE